MKDKIDSLSKDVLSWRAPLQKLIDQFNRNWECTNGGIFRESGQNVLLDLSAMQLFGTQRVIITINGAETPVLIPMKFTT